MSKVWDLSRGFLPAKDPIEKLPKKFRAWEELAEEAPKLLAAGQFGKRVKDLPILNADDLEDEEELECAMRHLAFNAHSEVWESWQTIPKQSISAPTAVPLYQVAKKLGRPPVLHYVSYAPYNFRRLDKKKPIELGNLALLQNFLGGIDEEWFILDHVDIQNQLIPAFDVAHGHRWEDITSDEKRLSDSLLDVAKSVNAANKVLLRMPEHCDPYVYYNRVRPYIHGWKGNPRLSQGIVYEGVKELKGKTQSWRGETGAQGSDIPNLDILLSVRHSDNLPDGSPDILKVYLTEMRDYMPKEHRKFLEDFAWVCTTNSIREYVLKNKANKTIVDAYNSCVNEVAKFRDTHLKYAEGYINKQAEKSPYNPTSTGTGGTPFMEYLKKHLDETRAAIIK